VSEAAKALMAKARESLASAEADLRAGRLNGGAVAPITRCFTPRERHWKCVHCYWRPAARHGHRPLRQDVRETGPLDPALGRALNKTLELRREADYDLGSLDPDDVRVRCKTPKR
jgi:hypothetical protein